MMTRRQILAAPALLAAVPGCSGLAPRFPPGGRPPVPPARIDPDDTPAIRARMRDGVNARRARAGAPPLRLDAQLNAAAAMHARDLAGQTRPRHTGSDGSSPVDRARRAGYRGTVLGETLSATRAAGTPTLDSWMSRPDTRAVITDPRGRDLGIAFRQEETGRIWWCLLVGHGGRAGTSGAPAR
jgi:uncharacterized protein YkwD